MEDFSSLDNMSESNESIQNSNQYNSSELNESIENSNKVNDSSELDDSIDNSEKPNEINNMSELSESIEELDTPKSNMYESPEISKANDNIYELGESIEDLDNMYQSNESIGSKSQKDDNKYNNIYSSFLNKEYKDSQCNILSKSNKININHLQNRKKYKSPFRKINFNI